LSETVGSAISTFHLLLAISILLPGSVPDGNPISNAACLAPLSRAACGTMTLHLIKLCVGVTTLSDLAALQAGRLPELYHVTRQTPKRAAELIPGGSLYWVMTGRIVARQRLLELRPVERDGVPYCALVYDPVLVTVEPRPRRPFQGWRYLTEEDAPPDIGVWTHESDKSLSLRNELVSFGLL
jgi:hypothetical protein